MRWAESGADEDGQVLDREREREKGRFLARPTAVVPTIGWSRGGAAAWSWSILFSTIERPETTPVRWAESGADGDGQVLDHERERERKGGFWRARLQSFRLSAGVVAARQRGPGQFSFRLLRDQRPRP